MEKFTAQQLIKKACLESLSNYQFCEFVIVEEITPEMIDDYFDSVKDDFPQLHDEIEEFRSSGEPSGIYAPFNINYESESVAREIDGQWVGWTHWHGGGKHGRPESIDWLSEAYLLNATQETRIVNVFSKVEE